jgi:hypothetical protein
MDAAAARLTAAVEALAAAITSSTSSSSTGVPSTTQEDVRQLALGVMLADTSCGILLLTLDPANSGLSRTGLFDDHISLPAAPAAVRLSLAVCQAQGKLQQLSQHPLLQPHSDITGACSKAVRAVPNLVLALAAGVEGGVSEALQAYPAARELVQMQELVSCVAVVLVAAALGLGASRDDGAAGIPAASSSSAPVRQQQQQEASSSSSGSLSIGMRLDSLTPLSCSLFDVLGVTKETVLHLARLITPNAVTTSGTFPTMTAAYKYLLTYQVSGSVGRQVVVQWPSF